MQEKQYRLIVKCNDGGFVNINVSRIERDDCVVFAYRENELVGVFDLGTVGMLYLSEAEKK